MKKSKIGKKNSICKSLKNSPLLKKKLPPLQGGAI